MVDFSKIKTYPIKERKNKVSIKDFVKLDSNLPEAIPDILAGKNLEEFATRVAEAHKNGRPVIMMFGAHVIKVGMSPILIDLMKRRVLTHIAMNGAGSIHDFEIALIGETSEDVLENVADGRFGMAEETGRFINEALVEGVKNGLGYGAAVGKKMVESDLEHAEHSVLANAYKLGIPATVHVAIGTDIIHQHPACDGAALGKASYDDFKLFTDSISKLEGGVLMNVGSAVVLPEVFIKALSIARNLGNEVKNITTANFDMIYHYRPRVNVVERPTAEGGKGYNFTGVHEVMVPLLYKKILGKLK